MWSDLFVLLELFIINFHFVKNCQIHFSCTIDFSKRHMNLCVLKINKILLCLEKEKQSLCSIFCLAVMDLTLKYVKLKSIVLNKIKMGMFHVLWWRKAGLVMEHSQSCSSSYRWKHTLKLTCKRTLYCLLFKRKYSV